MKAKATLKQIAKELGVSVSTVSKALNDSPEISEPTKIRIQEYAKLKNYKPNSIGLTLKTRRTKTIGVIIPNILNSFFAKVFSGIEKEAEEQGYKVITCISNESLEREKGALEMLSNGTADGFIVSIAEESQIQQEFSHFKSILADDIPIVLFDRITDEIRCDKVIVDDFNASVEATQYLLKTQCKKIALLSTIDNLSVGKYRANGYMEAMKLEGVEVAEELILRTDSHAIFDQKISELFDNQTFDGIFALDEYASVAAHKTALKKGLRIPEDISIIGFADGVWSRRLTPSLSTVSQHGPEIGQEAVRLLIQKIEHPSEEPSYKTSVIKTELRKRDSIRKI
jgi:LacI family transcriptional regulator